MAPRKKNKDVKTSGGTGKDMKRGAGRKKNVRDKVFGNNPGKVKGMSGSGRVVKRGEKKVKKGQKSRDMMRKKPTDKPKKASKSKASTSRRGVKMETGTKSRKTISKSKSTADVKPAQSKRKRKSDVGEGSGPKRRKKSQPEPEVVYDDTPLSPMDKLSLEVLCKIIGFLPLKDMLRLQCLSRTLQKAVSLHLRICKTLNFTEGEICGYMSEKMSDRTFGYLIHRCPDLTHIYGLHPKKFCRPPCPKHALLNDCLTVKGLVRILENCQKLSGIDTCNIHMLEAILYKLPHIKLLGMFKNRNGVFPAKPGTSFCLRPNPPITKIHLTGVILPDLPRMDSVIYLSLKWVKFTNVNPFREFMAPRLHTFVMNNCSGPTNALKYVPLVTRLAAASNLARLELVRVPFLGAFFQHVVEDTWRLGGFRQLKKILISACKHATEIDMGHLLLTAAESVTEVYIQPSLTKDSLFLSLSMAEPDFPKIDTINLGYVDPFPVEKGKWEPIQLTEAGLADAGSSENAALITDVGIQHVGKDFSFVKNLVAYNCPHLINPTDWLTPDGMSFAQLRSLHLNRCHAIKLQTFCDMLSKLPSIETVYIEKMFREPPKGCSRVGLSAGTGLGVSSAFVANQEPAPAGPDQGQAGSNQENPEVAEPPSGDGGEPVEEGSSRECADTGSAEMSGEGSGGVEKGNPESSKDEEPVVSSEDGEMKEKSSSSDGESGRDSGNTKKHQSLEQEQQVDQSESGVDIEKDGESGLEKRSGAESDTVGCGTRNKSTEDKEIKGKSCNNESCSNLEGHGRDSDDLKNEAQDRKLYSGKGKRPLGKKSYFKKSTKSKGDEEGQNEVCKESGVGNVDRMESGTSYDDHKVGENEVENSLHRSRSENSDGNENCEESGIVSDASKDFGNSGDKDEKSDDKKEVGTFEENSKEVEADSENCKKITATGSDSINDGKFGENGLSVNKEGGVGLGDSEHVEIDKTSEQSKSLDLNDDKCAENVDNQKDVSISPQNGKTAMPVDEDNSPNSDNCNRENHGKPKSSNLEATKSEVSRSPPAVIVSRSPPAEIVSRSPPAEMRKTVATQTSYMYEDASSLDMDLGQGPSHLGQPGPQAHSSPQESAAKKREIPVFRCLPHVEDEELEEDYPQVLTIRSRTLVSLTIHMIGVTHLVITDSPQMKVVHGTACRVLKEVHLKNTPKLTRVTFAQCRKLNHMGVVKDITKLPPTNDRFVFLRPMIKFDPVLIEQELFRADNGYHGCLIQDHSLDPGATQIQKARFIEKLKLVSSISFHILRLDKYPTFTKTVSDQPPWGRNLHNLSGKTPDNSPWEAVTDIPWLPHLESLSTTREENKDAVDIIEEKWGLHKLYTMDSIWPFGCFEGLAEAIAQAQLAESAIQPRTIGIYINTCDVSGIPTPDIYV